MSSDFVKLTIKQNTLVKCERIQNEDTFRRHMFLAFIAAAVVKLGKRVQTEGKYRQGDGATNRPFTVYISGNKAECQGLNLINQVFGLQSRPPVGHGSCSSPGAFRSISRQYPSWPGSGASILLLFGGLHKFERGLQTCLNQTPDELMFK